MYAVKWFAGDMRTKEWRIIKTQSNNLSVPTVLFSIFDAFTFQNYFRSALHYAICIYWLCFVIIVKYLNTGNSHHLCKDRRTKIDGAVGQQYSLVKCERTVFWIFSTVSSGVPDYSWKMWAWVISSPSSVWNILK